MALSDAIRPTTVSDAVRPIAQSDAARASPGRTDCVDDCGSSSMTENRLSLLALRCGGGADEMR
eukprot:5913111-Pyramimonas_sp.AAC.1